MDSEASDADADANADVPHADVGFVFRNPILHLRLRRMFVGSRRFGFVSMHFVKISDFKTNPRFPLVEDPLEKQNKRKLKIILLQNFFYY